MAAPVTQAIGTPFGRRGLHWAAGYHTGVDFLSPNGSTVRAPADSKIIFAGRGGWGSAYGIQVIGECKGTDGRTYRWISAHHASESVRAGQMVKLGDIIGKSNSTGNVTGPHLHFEVRYATKSTRDGRYGYWDHVNPTPVLNVKKATAPDTRTPEEIRMDPSSYGEGASGPHVTWLGEQLVEWGFGRFYSVGPGPVWGEADKAAVRAFQLAQGWTGAAADGLPGPLTLTRLAADPPVNLPDPELPPAVMLPRSKWTTAANGREGRPLSVDKVVALTLHYPGDGNVTYADLTQGDVAELLRAYRKHHISKTPPWADIGYNYAIDQAGRTWFLTGDNVGAHSDDAGNPSSIGVLLMVGNVETPSDEMVDAVRRLYAEKRVRFPLLDRIQGHRSVPGNDTACPGDPVMAALAAGEFTSDPNVPAPPPTRPDPDPVVGECDWRTLLINVDGGFRSDAAYNADIGAIVKMRDKARARWVFVVEQDSATNAIALSNAFGQHWKYTREQGRDSRLSAAIHFDERKDRLLDSGRFDISSSTHDNLTWGLFRDVETGVLRIGADTLLWPFPIGPNNTVKDDKIREDATRSALRQLRAYARQQATKHDVDVIPTLFGGDLNHPPNDKPDVVGNAMSSYGFTDSDKAANKRINGQFSTHAHPGGMRKGGRIDRFGIDTRSGMTCQEQVTLDGYAVGGKHNGVVVSTTASNTKPL